MLFFSRNWTKCLGEDLETAMRDGGLKTVVVEMFTKSKMPFQSNMCAPLMSPVLGYK